MPVALAAPDLLAILAIAFVLVLLLVALSIYATARQARGYAVDMPVISGPLVAAVDHVIAFDLSVARAVDNLVNSVLVSAVTAFGRLVVAIFNAAGAAILLTIHATADDASYAYAHVLTIEGKELPALAGRVGAIESLQEPLRSAVRGLARSEAQAAAAPILARLAGLELAVAQQAAAISTYRPLWDSLARVPGGVAYQLSRDAAQLAALAAAVGALDAALGAESSGVSALERSIAQQQAQLAKLAGLGALSLAGTAVVAELIRIAENPCMVCPGLNLNDLEGRVSSLELGGV